MSDKHGPRAPASDPTAQQACSPAGCAPARTIQERLEPRGVRMICPGEIATPLKLSAIAQAAERAGRAPDEAIAAERGRLGDPRGEARVLAFLASDEAASGRGTIVTR